MHVVWSVPSSLAHEPNAHQYLQVYAWSYGVAQNASGQHACTRQRAREFESGAEDEMECSKRDSDCLSVRRILESDALAHCSMSHSTQAGSCSAAQPSAFAGCCQAP